MADGGVVEAALITAAVGVATTAYTTSQAAKNAPKAPVMPVEQPKTPNVSTFATTQQQAEQAARTAGGTIKSDPNENKRQIGSAVKPPAQLLGQ